MVQREQRPVEGEPRAPPQVVVVGRECKVRDRLRVVRVAHDRPPHACEQRRVRTALFPRDISVRVTRVDGRRRTRVTEFEDLGSRVVFLEKNRNENPCRNEYKAEDRR